MNTARIYRQTQWVKRATGLGLLIVGSLLAKVARADSVTADIYECPASASSYYRSHLSGGSTGTDHWFFTENARTAGALFAIANLYSPMWTLFYDGRTEQSGGASFYGTLSQTKTNVPTLLGPPGGEVQIVPQLPEGYDGHHGSLHVTAAHPQRGGWLLQLNNNLSGTAGSTDDALVVGWAGTLEWPGGRQSNNFPRCGGGEQLPAEGSAIGITDGGYGNATEGAIIYAPDRKLVCYCRPDLADGGAIGTSGDGWAMLNTGIPCSP